MKIAGILFMGLIAGVLAAAASLVMGWGLWSALANYLAFGMAATVLAVLALFWRAYESERPSRSTLMVGAQATPGK